MRRLPILLLTSLALALAASAQEPPKPAPEPLKINVGDKAPDFTLLHYDGTATKPVSLADFRGRKNVIVAFFVFAFTGG